MSDRHLYKRDGVQVGRPRKPWQKYWHHELEPKFMQVGLQALGVYGWLRVLAGKAQSEGGVLVDGEPEAKKRDVQRWIARRIGGDQWRQHEAAAGELLEELRRAELIVWGRTGTVILVNWAIEQTRAPSYDAERQREYRQRAGAGDGSREAPQLSEDRAPGDGREESPAPGLSGRCSASPTGAPEVPHPSPPAASTSTSTSGAFGLVRPEKTDVDRGVTCHTQRSDERGQNRPSNSTSDGGRGRPPLSAAGGEGWGTSGEDAGDDLYALPPVEAACRLTGERGAWARHGFDRQLERVGADVFTRALGDFRQAIADGVQPKTTRGGMLHGIINRIAPRHQG